jgi:hypothetical protein
VVAANAGQDEHARQHLGSLLQEAEAMRMRRKQRLVQADVLADAAEQLDGRIAVRRQPQVDGRVVVQFEELAQSAAVVEMMVREDHSLD